MKQGNMRVAESAERPRKHYAPQEWQTRLELAAAYRLIEHFGMTDLIYNHITARIPDSDHQYLINPYGLHYSEITASNLVKIDLDGKILEETQSEINPAGYVIHSAIHAARPDIQCIVHTHSRAGTVVSALPDGFVPVAQGGFQFYNRVAYHDYEGFALDEQERRRLVEDLGRHKVMIMRNHGVIVCGRSVPEAVRLMYYFEQACQLQVDVMAVGGKPSLPPGQVMEHTARQWEEGAAGIGTTEAREWPALLRLIDRIDPSWRN